MMKGGRKIVFTSTLGHLYQNQAVLAGKRPLRIDNLFKNPERELFELDYLHKSSHIQSSASYRWLVSILEQFNEDTKLLQNQTDNKKQFNNDHILLNISCMRFIYREMLGIAVMSERELNENDFATKLKQWYLGLNQRHSFLEGVSITWKKINKAEQIKLQEMIRLSYTSNVFDGLDDYLRRSIIAFQPTGQPQKQNTTFPKTKSLFRQAQDINLPQIDVMIYRREVRNMRELREKKIQQNFINTIAKNQNKLREICINNRLKSQWARRGKQTVTEPEERVQLKTTLQPPRPIDQDKKNRRSSSILFDDSAKISHLDWRKHCKLSAAPHDQNSRNNLININGIGLIRSNGE